jgi:hypothetical protein
MRDADVRQAVRQRLASDHSDDADTLIVEEMGVWANSVRIDIAVINGELSGIELKSDRDTLVRLPLQAEIYSRVFDRLRLVVGTRHLEKALPMVPTWWGITVASVQDSHLQLTELRDGSLNPGADPFLVAHLLWKAEALTVLDRYGLARGWRGKRSKQIYEHLAREVPKPELFAHVREALKRRVGWLGQNGSHQLDVPVNSQADPMGQRFGTLCPPSDLVDSVVRPAGSKPTPSRKSKNEFRMLD